MWSDASHPQVEAEIGVHSAALDVVAGAARVRAGVAVADVVQNQRLRPRKARLRRYVVPVLVVVDVRRRIRRRGLAPIHYRVAVRHRHTHVGLPGELAQVRHGYPARRRSYGRGSVVWHTLVIAGHRTVLTLETYDLTISWINFNTICIRKNRTEVNR